jgi:hypothetical protein
MSYRQQPRSVTLQEPCCLLAWRHGLPQLGRYGCGDVLIFKADNG